MHFNKARYKLIQFIDKLLKLLPLAFWILLIFGFDTVYIAILTVISAVIHELGHIFVSVKAKKISKLHTHVSGFRLYIENCPSYRQTILIALGGPAANIAVFLISLPLGNIMGGYFRIFGLVNLMTCLSNLLPINGYDGYNILYSLLCLLCPYEIGERLMKILSFTLSVLLAFFSLYLMARLDAGYFIYFIFIWIIMKAVFNDRKAIRKKTRANERFQEKKRAK